MTKHKIDDLFNQKLAGSEFTPSPAAWSKLENQLAQKKSKGIVFYMSIAASIILLLSFGWLMFKSEEVMSPIENIAQNTTEQSINIISPDTVKTQVKTPAIDDDILEEKNSDKDIKQNDEVKNKTKLPVAPQKQKVKKQNTPLIIIQQKSNLAVNDNPIEVQREIEDSKDQVILSDIVDLNESIALNNPSEITNTPSKESGSIKLVYTLKPAITSESIAQETAKKTKNSPFKKMVAFAKNIKENPKGIGNLRDAKNNFLSLSKKKNDSK